VLYSLKEERKEALLSMNVNTRLYFVMDGVSVIRSRDLVHVNIQ